MIKCNAEKISESCFFEFLVFRIFKPVEEIRLHLSNAFFSVLLLHVTTKNAFFQLLEFFQHQKFSGKQFSCENKFTNPISSPLSHGIYPKPVTEKRKVVYRFPSVFISFKTDQMTLTVSNFTPRRSDWFANRCNLSGIPKNERIYRLHTNPCPWNVSLFQHELSKPRHRFSDC